MPVRLEVDPRELAARLGYEFRDPALLEAALTHASALPLGAVRCGEQLEFLGDAVLDLAIADLLLRTFPNEDEGQLSKRRAGLVKTSTLAAKARELGFGAALRLGRGEERSGGRSKASILAAAYEAILGAVFLDGGFGSAHAVVDRHFAAELASDRPVGAEDWKTMLQERTQATVRAVPEYRLLAEEGPAHAPHFTIQVWLAGRFLAQGDGPNKRQAEQAAARAALDRLADRPASD